MELQLFEESAICSLWMWLVRCDLTTYVRRTDTQAVPIGQEIGVVCVIDESGRFR